MKPPYGSQVAIRRRAVGKAVRLAATSHLLLEKLPAAILGCYPVTQYGLNAGLSAAASLWRAQIAGGVVPEADMRASIVPVAVLLSAMLDALLHAVPIDQREAAFERLAEESDRILSGRPQAVVIQSGVL